MQDWIQPVWQEIEDVLVNTPNTVRRGQAKGTSRLVWGTLWVHRGILIPCCLSPQCGTKVWLWRDRSRLHFDCYWELLKITVYISLPRPALISTCFPGWKWDRLVIWGLGIRKLLIRGMKWLKSQTLATPSVITLKGLGDSKPRDLPVPLSLLRLFGFIGEGLNSVHDFWYLPKPGGTYTHAF